MRFFGIGLFILMLESVTAQFNSRLVIGTDLYQWYSNPLKVGSTASSSSGGVLSAILGSEIMAGRNNYSVGLEANVNLGWLDFDTDYKGWGAVSFPFILKLNSGSLSGFSDKLIGWSIGLGMQYQKTELFGLTDAYQFTHRIFFPTYIGQIELAGGIGGLILAYYIRLGKNPCLENAISFNTGLLFRLNYFHKNVQTKKNSNPLKS